MEVLRFYLFTCLICLLRNFFIRDKTKYNDTVLIIEAMTPILNIFYLFTREDSYYEN